MSRRRALAARPAEASDRTIPGHWEADLMGFSKYGQYVLVTHERSSRLLRVERLPDKTAMSVRTRLSEWLTTLPKPLRRSLTFDNVLYQ